LTMASTSCSVMSPCTKVIFISSTYARLWDEFGRLVGSVEKSEKGQRWTH
jgi:hypothetical protein